MGRKNKKKESNFMVEDEAILNQDESIESESEATVEEVFTENEEANQDVKVEKKYGPPAKMPQVKKGIESGKITFDIFFAYCLKKHPDKVKISHYRAMKNYLAQKNCDTISTKDGFCRVFATYGLLIT